MIEQSKLWAPNAKRIDDSNLSKFLKYISTQVSQHIPDSKTLYRWSISNSAQFWEICSSFLEIKFHSPSTKIIESTGTLENTRWFSGATLNFAENLLKRSDDHPALIFRSEQTYRLVLTYKELNQQVFALAATLRKLGVEKGDRVAAFMPNMPETIIGMLAATSLGAVWSSCSADFGVTGVLDRFEQIAPKVLIAADGYFFKGAPISCVERIRDIAAQLPTLKATIIVPFINAVLPEIAHALKWEDAIRNPGPREFTAVPFNHPLYIMFSSGTTGKPKCIVHSVGGTLLEHLKELVLHTDIQPTDVFLYQTTCGWMMWNLKVSALAIGATLVLYDGAPMLNSGKILFDIVEQEKVSIYGTSAKYIALVEKEGVTPKNTHNLSALRSLLSTGSPLLPESFDYIYRDIKEDLCLSSIAGGTDILGCFTLGSPDLPVYRGATQGLSFGLDVAVFNEHGERLLGEKGELVCCNAFPSMPIGFWGDVDGSKYKRAYFERFPGVWHHGDFVELTPEGGLIYFGRSDSVLNPGGVRIGSSEIYRQVEQLPEVLEAVVVGQDWDGDVRVVLFVRLREDMTLDAALKDKICKTIRKNTSPFHVPKKILQIADIPRTRSNKIAELAVRDVIHGREIKNQEALANPESLELYRNLEELKS